MMGRPRILALGGLGYSLCSLIVADGETEAQAGEGVCSGARREFQLSEVSLLGRTLSKKYRERPCFW